ncbi:MAG: transglycosylase domain-containing protein, partial [Candidatus Acidiferrales bacterium]
MRIRIGRGFWSSRLGLTFLGVALLVLVAGAGFFTYFYVSYARMIERRLAGGPSQKTSRIYTAPARIFTGQALAPNELANYMQRAGYTETPVEGAAGLFSVHGSVVELRPSDQSNFGKTNALRVEFAGHEIKQIRSLDNGALLASADVEPELLTNLFDSSREKRRPVRFDDIPKVLVDAVLSAEDKRFFEHPGFDPFRILGAAWADLRHEKLAQGASTITMQAARSFFFSTERTWRRKLAETLVALQLERRFSKQEIFELYANEIYLGNRGSFAIHGFGEASQAYFGKDIHQLSLGESAFLAGIIRAPNRYSSAERKSERAVEARDRVLKQMVDNHAISSEA